MDLDAIIEAGRELFGQKGLAAVRLDAVEGASEHFDDDSALRRALVVESLQRALAETEPSVVAAPTGVAALEAFIAGHARTYLLSPVDGQLAIAGANPGAIELMKPDAPFREALQQSGQRHLGVVASKLFDDWGQGLPQGIQPHRLAFTAYASIIGMSTMMAAIRASGDTMVAEPDVYITELCRALCSPTEAMGQLSALNEVAGEMAGMRDEVALLEAVPRLSRQSLGVRDAKFVAADGEIDDAVRAAIDACRTVADGTSIIAPVVCRGEPIGALLAAADHELDRRDVSRFETFATLLGLALDNARWVRLIQQEKMASLSKLVAGVAHELNTPLGALIAGADVTERVLDRLAAAIESGDADRATRSLAILRDTLATTKDASRRIDERVRALRNFARLDEAERKRANLHDGIDSTLMLLVQQLGDVQIIKHYGELPAVDCLPNELNQLFMNLLLNAAFAVRGEGTITIGTAVDGDDVTLRFTDDGSGIREEHVTQIFEPGFTAWDVGVGAGLGLSTCQQIVARHAGRIDVTTELGVGSTFTVRLPLR